MRWPLEEEEETLLLLLYRLRMVRSPGISVRCVGCHAKTYFTTIYLKPTVLLSIGFGDQRALRWMHPQENTFASSEITHASPPPTLRENTQESTCTLEKERLMATSGQAHPELVLTPHTDLPTNTVPLANSLDRPTSCSIDRSLQVPAKQSPLEATGAYIRRAPSCEMSQLKPQVSATFMHSTYTHTHTCTWPLATHSSSLSRCIHTHTLSLTHTQGYIGAVLLLELRSSENG
jgi:hypothetical protein